MDFFKIFKSEVPDYKKEDLLNSIDDSQKALNDKDGVINAYKDFLNIVGKNENKQFIIDNNDVNTFFSLFSLHAKIKYNTINQALFSIKLMLDNIDKILDSLPKAIETQFSEDNSTINITYPKVNYLGLIYAINFTINFSIDLLNFVVSAYSDPEDQYKEIYTKEKIKSILENVKGFASCYDTLIKKPEDIFKYIKDIPDYIIDDKTNAVISNTYSKNKMDPFNTRGFMNPFYFFAIRKAEWRANRYHSYVEKNKLLQLRLLSLKNKLNNNPNDLQLQKTIEYTEGRISKLQSKINDIEDEVRGM